MLDIEKIKFARTTWANIQLSKLCPGNEIGKLQELFETTDFAQQMESMISIILILKDAYDRRAKFEDKDFEPYPLTREILENLDEEEISSLLNKAFETFGIDGETSVETKAKKTKKAKSPSN